jgi:hypothetical protein
MADKMGLILDFDGCVHSYTSGWIDIETIPDPPVKGVMDWLEVAVIYFDVYIYSVRSSEKSGRKAMFEYIKEHAGPNSTLASRLKFVHKKPRAFITIDDRCICFNGNWSAPELDPRKIMEFLPWNRREK